VALKRVNEIKRYTSVNTIELKPNEGEALRVKKIEVKASTDPTYMEIDIGKSTVGYFPVYVDGVEFFATSKLGQTTKNLFDVLKEHGVDLVYPVASGESFILKFTKTVDYVRVIYDVYEAGDVNPTEVNGSKADMLTYAAILTNVNPITTPDWYTLDKLLNPPEMPDFPTGIVPSGYRITVHSIGVIPQLEGTSPDTAETDYLRLWYRRQVLFDPDRNGFKISTTINELPPIEQNNEKMVFFGQELTFIEGDELNVQVKVNISGDGSLSAEKVKVIMLQTMSPLR